MISLIATDLDGTLLYDRAHIADRDRQALFAVHDAGSVVAIATGREFSAIAPTLDQLQLWDAVDYIIMAGGAQIYDVKKRSVQMGAQLTPDMLCDVYKRYRGYDISVVLPQDGKFYTSRIIPEMVEESKLLHAPLVLCEDMTKIFTSPISKLIFHGTRHEVEAILPIMAKDTDERIVLCQSHNNYIDCYAAGVNKGQALLQLCAQLHIPIAQAAAIGDNHNDLDLLRTAGKAGCPGDGVLQAREAADYVCCAAAEGAFADFCQWLGLI